jgi:hypothetical protein
MANGYTRQSSAQIVNGAIIFAVAFNNEYNAIQTAFDAVVGHDHDGTTGGGAPLPWQALQTNQDWSTAGTNNPKTFVIQDGSNFSIKNQADTTKVVQFALGGLTTGQIRTLTVPDISDTIVTLSAAQTLTNKTLQATLLNFCSIEVFDSSITIFNTADPTKQLQFSCASISHGVGRTITVPDISDTMVTLTATQTLSNKTISLPIETINDNQWTMQNSSDNTKQLQFSLAGITTGTLRTLTIPNVSDTLVTLSATQTLTNKTLTTPVISQIVNTGTLTLPTSTDTLVGRATTDTLTNKTISAVILSGGGTLSGTFTGGTLNAAAVTSTAAIPVSSGGTGLATLTSANLLVGAGTSSPTFIAPGATGNVLISNGTNWVGSLAGTGVDPIFTSVSPGGSTNEATLTLYHNQTTVNNSDVAATILMQANNASLAQKSYARIKCIATNTAAGAEGGSLKFNTWVNGTETNLLSGGVGTGATTDGGWFTNGATGVGQGAGTINATGLFVNGNSLGDGSIHAATNGWVDLPGGIIMQWGTATASLNTTTAISFPKSFPNNGFNINITPLGGFITSPTSQTWNIVTSSLSTSGFTINNPETSGTTSFYWMAIGN